jgi:hypothetical protein
VSVRLEARSLSKLQSWRPGWRRLVEKAVEGASVVLVAPGGPVGLGAAAKAVAEEDTLGLKDLSVMLDQPVGKDRGEPMAKASGS